LRGADLLLLGHGPDAFDQLKVAIEIISLETRVEAAVVVGGEVIRRLQFTRQKTTPKGL
jgi:hypothetical protein